MLSVIDSGAKFGTFVNGKQINKVASLLEGDLITFGAASTRFQCIVTHFAPYLSELGSDIRDRTQQHLKEKGLTVAMDLSEATDFITDDYEPSGKLAQAICDGLRIGNLKSIHNILKGHWNLAGSHNIPVQTRGQNLAGECFHFPDQVWVWAFSTIY